MSPLAAPDSPDVCALILTLLSYLLIMVTMPISLCMCIKVFILVTFREGYWTTLFETLSVFPPISLTVFSQVVQEYERAVIFRLGRLRKGGAKGPGIFFVIPCVDNYRKVDLRTVSFDVPPQEVRLE